MNIKKNLSKLVYISMVILVLNSISCTRKSKNSEESVTKKSENEYIIEIRSAVKDGIYIREGPGLNHGFDESGQLFKEEKIYVLEEKDGWIRFRVTAEDVGWNGWVKKDSTVLESNTGRIKSDDEISKLRESGLLKNINPQLNEAYIDPKIWNELTIQTKENIGKVLAIYCGEKKGTNLNWVDIKDAFSGQELARYSQSRGFKEY